MTDWPTDPLQMRRSPPTEQGFSLVELAVVLVIVALLSSGLMLGLSAQRDSAANQEVQRQLDTAREVLLGFAMANGRLPCPAIRPWPAAPPTQAWKTGPMPTRPATAATACCPGPPSVCQKLTPGASV